MFKILRYRFMFWVLLPLRNLIKANFHSNNSILLLYITWNKHLAHLWFYHSNISSIKIELNMTKSLFYFTDVSFFYQGIADPNTTKSKMKQNKKKFIWKRATTQRTYFHHFNFYSKKYWFWTPNRIHFGSYACCLCGKVKCV